MARSIRKESQSADQSSIEVSSIHRRNRSPREVLQVEHTITGNPNAVLADRKIRCIYAVLANKIVIYIYLCSCVVMSLFGRELNPIRDG